MRRSFNLMDDVARRARQRRSLRLFVVRARNVPELPAIGHSIVGDVRYASDPLPSMPHPPLRCLPNGVVPSKCLKLSWICLLCACRPRVGLCQACDEVIAAGSATVTPNSIESSASPASRASHIGASTTRFLNEASGDEDRRGELTISPWALAQTSARRHSIALLIRHDGQRMRSGVLQQHGTALGRLARSTAQGRGPGAHGHWESRKEDNERAIEPLVDGPR